MNEKHRLPTRPPSRADAAYDRLTIPPGPWNDDYWAIVEQGGDLLRSRATCEVVTCDTFAWSQHAGHAVCQPHWFQWRRAEVNGPLTFDEWAPAARQPQQRVRSNAVTNRRIPFAELPGQAAFEMRFVAATKISEGDWTPNRDLLDTMLALVTAFKQSEAQSFLDRSPEEWTLRALQHLTPSARRTSASYFKTFFTTLHRALIRDPWAEDVWLWRYCFDRIVHPNAVQPDGYNIHWEHIEQEWLRNAVRKWARICLSLGTRSWGTIGNWARGLRQFSEYLSTEGISEPHQVNRALFRDYVADLVEEGASKNALQNANTVAAVLADLQDEEIGLELGSEIFLRYGENKIDKLRNPKPYPSDIIEAVDEKVLIDPLMDPTARLMLQLTRWGGLRISELVSLPVDSIVGTAKGAYWIRYLMRKVRKMRGFPIPDDLAEALIAQRVLVGLRYGKKARYLFPSPARSNEAVKVAVPWSAAGFRGHIASAFERNGITHSSITGEYVSGGEIHRYRHTIGTALLNAGWSLAEVQAFLGHASGQMTLNYAEILDETLVNKMRDFYARNSAQRNQLFENLPNIEPVIESVRARFAYAMPVGNCTLPASRKCDFRDNPCATCKFFDASGEVFMAVNEGQAKSLKLSITNAGSDVERSLAGKGLAEMEIMMEKNR